MFSPGSKLLETTSKPSRRSCICESPKCKALSLCFQSMSDVRGLFMALPSVNGDRLSELKEFKLKRSLVHLGQNRTDKSRWACSVDQRDRSKTANISPGEIAQPNAVTPDDHDTVPISTNELKEVNVRVRLSGRLNDGARGSGTATLQADVLQKIATSALPTRSTKYVANHHFHPEVLQAMMDQGKSSIDCIPVQLIKDFDLAGKGYTAADLFEGPLPNSQEGPVYVPTPSYKNAKDDYKLVSTRWRLNRMVASCRAKRRGNCTLAPRGEDDILVPVQKRGRIDPLPDMDPDSKDDLHRAICMLSDELDEAYNEINRLKDEMKLRDALWREGDAKLEHFSKETMGGLNRLNISSDVYHRNNPNTAKTLFAFHDRRKDGTLSSWEITKEFMKIMFDVDHKEPTISDLFDAGGRRKKLSRFEQCLIALMWFQNLFEHEYIASIFGCDRTLVSRVIKWWAPHFHEVGCHMARLPLNEDFLKKAYPQSYIDLNFSNYVASVCDGTDVLCKTVRIDRFVNVVLRSNKVEHSAFRGVTWSLPYGLVHEFTDPFFGRGSEQAIVKIWAGHGRFRDIPVGWLISGDKGFAQTSVFYPYYNQILHPAFLTGGKNAQFTEQQMDWNRKACEKRYTSEVVFSRFKKYGGLGQIIGRNYFHYVHYLWAWAHGMTNTYLPLQQPANCTYFSKSKYSKKNF